MRIRSASTEDRRFSRIRGSDLRSIRPILPHSTQRDERCSPILRRFRQTGYLGEGLAGKALAAFRGNQYTDEPLWKVRLAVQTPTNNQPYFFADQTKGAQHVQSTPEGFFRGVCDDQGRILLTPPRGREQDQQIHSE